MDQAVFDQTSASPANVVLPELAVTPTRMQLFMFSAATWNRHHVHYDRAAAEEEGLPDIVVHRALIGNYFVRHLTGWLEDRGFIQKIAWKVLRSATPDQRLRCQGVMSRQVGEAGENQLTAEMTMLNDAGETVATATATVCLPDF